MSTHRTHPDNAQDIVVLKNLLSEARERVVNEFGKRDVSSLLDKIDNLDKEIDANYNLDSLHIFLSNSTKEIVKSPWAVQQNTVHISDSFSINPLIKLFNRTENYLILLLSQSGVKLFHAVDDSIVAEIKNDDFPFTQNPHYLTHHDKLSDGKQVDNMVREFLNKVDKAVVSIYNENEMNCIAICTEDNYSRLMQVADKSSVYYGFIPINYNDTSNHTIVTGAWNMVKGRQKQNRTNAIQEMQEAVGKGKVITDLSDIFRAVKEGRGDLLITQDGFHQAVKMTGEFTFDLVDDVTQANAIDDITSEIAREIISKKGRAIFTNQDELESFGNIALKVRY
ncbi:MAG TPA: hypothetical protein PLD84_00660 [Chitinophagales bacterium]|nr:hypothetical protein [Chitinophagales bacterium]